LATDPELAALPTSGPETQGSSHLFASSRGHTVTLWYIHTWCWPKFPPSAKFNEGPERTVPEILSSVGYSKPTTSAQQAICRYMCYSATIYAACSRVVNMKIQFTKNILKHLKLNGNPSRGG